VYEYNLLLSEINKAYYRDIGFSVIAQPHFISILFWLPCVSLCRLWRPVLKMPFQSGNSSALHQGAIKDAVLVVDRLTFHW